MSSQDSPAAAEPRRRVRRVLQVIAEPVREESRTLLEQNWQTLPAHLRTGQQMLGVQGNGCGATIGAMPRCDFACRGCYLGESANRIPAEPVDAIKRQMEALRPILGPDGNLQLTDGEVTLRPPEEVIELLQHAHSLELVPMLMTHGDSFRRRPGLLERYLTEGDLVEVSIHVDTTQRGRLGVRRFVVVEPQPLLALLPGLDQELVEMAGRFRRGFLLQGEMSVGGARSSDLGPDHRRTPLPAKPRRPGV